VPRYTRTIATRSGGTRRIPTLLYGLAGVPVLRQLVSKLERGTAGLAKLEREQLELFKVGGGRFTQEGRQVASDKLLLVVLLLLVLLLPPSIAPSSSSSSANALLYPSS
jgi:hypothetical protein